MAEKIRKQNRVRSSQIFGDYLIMMLALTGVAVAFYSVRCLYITAVSIAAAVVADVLMSAIVGKKFYIKDLSSVFSGAAIALMMPAGIEWYIPALASAFAVAVVKIPLGGGLKSPFVPAAAGFAFASVCFKEQVFAYTENTANKLLGSVSLGSMLMNGSSVRVTWSNVFDIISGNVAGPMGTGCLILMLGCCAYLFVRRRKALLATLGFVVSCAAFAAVFPRINAGIMTNILLELSSGSLMFAAVFLITDYATLPQKSLNKILYGAICGIICMSMRALGSYEETVCFAILLANGIRPVFDSAVSSIPARKQTASVRKGAAKVE